MLSLGAERQQNTAVLEEQVSSSTSKGPEVLSTLEDTQDSNIPKGFGDQKGCLAALLGLGQGLSRHWDEMTLEDEMRVKEQRHKSSSPWEMRSN